MVELKDARLQSRNYTSSTAFLKTASDASQYNAVVAMFLCSINHWIVFIPTPLSFNLVANVLRPECDEVRMPANSYISLNNIDRLTFEKKRPLRCDPINGASTWQLVRAFKCAAISRLTRSAKTTVLPFDLFVCCALSFISHLGSRSSFATSPTLNAEISPTRIPA
jgi:hypothetical protein